MAMEKVAALVRRAAQESGFVETLGRDPAQLRNVIGLTDAHMAALRSAEALAPPLSGAAQAIAIGTGTLYPPEGSGTMGIDYVVVAAPGTDPPGTSPTVAPLPPLAPPPAAPAPRAPVPPPIGAPVPASGVRARHRPRPPRRFPRLSHPRLSRPSHPRRPGRGVRRLDPPHPEQAGNERLRQGPLRCSSFRTGRHAAARRSRRWWRSFRRRQFPR